jgi:DNA-damage-inducible protein D
MFDMQHFEGSAKENGMHYWLAHEFMAALGYETWPSFCYLRLMVNPPFTGK